MYGTVARLKVKPGMEDKLKELSDKFKTEKVPGAMMDFIYRMDNNPNEYYMVVMFDSKESYHANANDPKQHTRYQEMMQMMDAEPEWHDGEIVSHTTYSK